MVKRYKLDRKFFEECLEVYEKGRWIEVDFMTYLNELNLIFMEAYDGGLCGAIRSDMPSVDLKELLLNHLYENADNNYDSLEDYREKTGDTVFNPGVEDYGMLGVLEASLKKTLKDIRSIRRRKLESPIEKKFWDKAHDMKLEDGSSLLPGLQYQIPVDRYRVDFAIRNKYDKMFAIEIDGHDYHKTKEQRTHDAKKDRRLKELGWEVIRFTGTEVFKDSESCIKQVYKIINCNQ